MQTGGTYMESAYRGLRSFNDDATMTTWLKRLVHNYDHVYEEESLTRQRRQLYCTQIQDTHTKYNLN